MKKVSMYICGDGHMSLQIFGDDEHVDGYSEQFEMTDTEFRDAMNVINKYGVLFDAVAERLYQRRLEKSRR